MSDDAHQGDIIIVKRGGGAHDDHHGGVWKIAFADFMTAMMAFFLVMWLINASDEETKKTVASYFNPIELMDITTNPKGLTDPKYGVKKLPVENPDSLKNKSTSELNKEARDEQGGYYDEEALFKDPIAMLSEIAGGIPQKEDEVGRPDEKKEDAQNNLALSGGERFQDPFDPASWQNQFGLESDTSGLGKAKVVEPDELAKLNVDDNPGLVPLKGGFKEFEMNAEVPDDEAALRPQLNVEPDDANKNEETKEADAPGDLSKQVADNKKEASKEGKVGGEGEGTSEGNDASKMAKMDGTEGADGAGEADEIGGGDGDKMAKDKIAKMEGAGDSKLVDGKLVDGEGRKLDVVSTSTNRDLEGKPLEEEQMSGQQQELANAIDQINEELAKQPDSNLKVDYVSKEGGSLITLSERASSGMFNIGSAKPTQQMVKIMAKIGSVIAKTNGLVTVSGHTDGRQYKSRSYNNWRLSTDRAHMAYFMLVNGGVPKASFERIEGYADTKLIVADDPNAAENRRIEVFIRQL
ncbi:MAG: MotB family protein [Nitratireductor sp.]